MSRIVNIIVRTFLANTRLNVVAKLNYSLGDVSTVDYSSVPR